MSLRSLLPLLEQASGYSELLKLLQQGAGTQRATVRGATKAFLIASLYHNLRRPILVLTARPDEARGLSEELITWLGPEGTVFHFPEREALPFERLTPDVATLHARLGSLAAFQGATPAPPLVVASVAAALQKTLERQTFASLCHKLRVGQEMDLGALLSLWQRMGYVLEPAVEVPGTMSRRGGILDIFPPGAQRPLRIELWGNEIESLRLFDPERQRSVEFTDSFFIPPARELLPLVASREQVEALVQKLDFSNCTPSTRSRIEEELSFLLDGREVEDQGLYMGFFGQGSLLDYLPHEGLLVLDEPWHLKEAAQELEDRIREQRRVKEERGEIPRHFPSPCIGAQELWARVACHPRCLAIQQWGMPGGFALDSSSPGQYWGKLGLFLREVREWLRREERVVVVTHHKQRLMEILGEEGVPVEEMKDSGLPSPGVVTVALGALPEGLTLAEPRLVLLTDAEIFGASKAERPVRKRPVRREAFLSELVPGSYLVHVEHGVGRFTGTVHLATGQGEGEYLVLEYAEGDKLYVPTDHLDRVSPYRGPEGRPPSLTRLGTQEWTRTKERVKQSTREMARELLSLYAARSLAQGHAFSPDTPWQRELEEAFPYLETPDQLLAIQEVKSDMEAPRPMDRLVCGDVGYGKTEIALRAAFKAVMDGMQVAVLVPTTILAQQHYATFSQRLSPYPVRVEVLSRFRPLKEQQEVLEGLVQGKVDICIGTHRLLQKDVRFRRLGLVIVDEEHRFGVAHKERLKQMRQEVDVLTLSATPIPRTLYMALSGIRDMSIMETPPEERRPIKTYVSEYSEELIREAVLRELDRGGQVFFVHNRVRGIEQVAAQVQALVPQARIAIAHGRMPEEELGEVMARFITREVDVLVCTTIIEAGLDLPSANTLIVNRADCLGLAQLYQLRGRVGRGVQQAYAYFLVPRGKRITEAAEKRLKTILAATELGAGFRIAMKDLEIRGAGNLLGPEQSGHIHAVGFDLYCQLLAEAVEELKSRELPAAEAAAPTRKKQALPVQIDLPLKAHIPPDYISDLPTRLGIYQRLTQVGDPQEVEDLKAELRDRFGPLPQPLENLLYIVKLKALAAKAGVVRLSQEGDYLVLRCKEPVAGARLALQRALGEGAHVGHTQIRLPWDGGEGCWREELPQALERVAAFRQEVERWANTYQSG